MRADRAGWLAVAAVLVAAGGTGLYAVTATPAPLTAGADAVTTIAPSGDTTASTASTDTTEGSTTTQAPSLPGTSATTAATGEVTTTAVEPGPTTTVQGSTTTAPRTQDVTISLVGGTDVLPSLAGEWPTWTGEPSGIVYNPEADGLVIPAPAAGQDMVIGVRRFTQPLTAGTEYTLGLTSANPNAAVIIFLFDEAGNLLPLVEEGGLAIAQDGKPLVFNAPAGTAGFYLQVQNSWRATDAAVVKPTLKVPAVDPGPDPVTLIDPTGGWTNWFGDPAAGVAFDPAIGRVAIAAPGAGQDLRFGVRRAPLTLNEGQLYELGALAESEASVLLFLFDANDQLISSGSVAWISATASSPAEVATCTTCLVGATQFVAPAGVASVAVQVQGPWGVSAPTSILPTLTAVSSPPSAA